MLVMFPILEAILRYGLWLSCEVDDSGCPKDTQQTTEIKLFG